MKCEHFVEAESCKICNQTLNEINEQIKAKGFSQWLNQLDSLKKIPSEPIYEEPIEKKKKFKWIMPKHWKSENQKQA